MSKKSGLRKITSAGFGGVWIGAGLLTGVVIPGIIWLAGGEAPLWMMIAGAVILLAFFILLRIRMRQDNGKVPGYDERLKEVLPFDPEKQEAVIRCSVCTGEQVAGFRDRTDGHFTEVMLLKTPEDEERFRKMFGLGSVRKIY